MRGHLKPRDVLFIVETLLPASADPQHLADRLQADETRLESTLDDSRLFQRLMQAPSMLPQISPCCWFS